MKINIKIIYKIICVITAFSLSMMFSGCINQKTDGVRLESEVIESTKNDKNIENIEDIENINKVEFEDKKTISLNNREEILYINGFGTEEVNETFATLDDNLKNWNSFFIWENSQEYVSGTIDNIASRYLEEKGVEISNPSGIYYFNEEPISKYFINKDKNEISFIINFPYENEDAIFVTFDLDTIEHKGYIDYELDENGRTVAEKSYNNILFETFDVKYNYIEGLPFTLISSPEFVADEYIYDYKLQQWDKYIYYDDRVVFDETGRLIADNKVGEGSFVEYNEDNQVVRIERLGKGLYGQDEVYYEEYFYEKSNLVKSEYFHHGSTDGSGIIIYDDMGRIIYNSYYITHGRVYNFYLYSGDSRRPDAIITYDSYSYSGGSEDNILYSMGSCQVSINIFSEVEKIDEVNKINHFDENCLDFITSNSTNIKGLISYIESGDFQNILTDKYYIGEEFIYTRRFDKTTKEFIYEIKGYTNGIDSGNTYRITDSNNIITKFLEFTAENVGKYLKGVDEGEVLDINLTYKNGKVVISGIIDSQNTNKTVFIMRYLGGLKGDVKDIENWEFEQFLY